MNQADRDELRGQDWMRSLVQPAHAAIPVAVDAGGHAFRASCGCGWRGETHRGRDPDLARTRAERDAAAHQAGAKMTLVELRIRSWSDPERVYAVRISSAGVTCSCRGFGYGGHCQHADRVVTFLRDVQAISIGEVAVEVERYDRARALPEVRRSGPGA